MTILKSAWLFLLSAAGAICFGQSPNQGSITGKILTAAGNGAPVPKAPVVAKNLATQATYKAASAADGSYNLSGLPAGDYEISMESSVQSRFVPFHQSGLRVGAGETTKLDIRLDNTDLSTLDGREAIRDQLAPSGPTPRASNGKPDLSGLWLIDELPGLVGEAPDPLPGSTVPRGLGLTIRCLPLGISRVGSSEYQLVQTPALIVILDGGFSPTRLIYLDGRGHPKDFNPSWMGHSIGHWEADTLVVETAGFNELGRIGGTLGGLAQSFPQTEKLRVTERFRRPDLGHLEVENTYDDPGTFKTFKTRYVKKLAPKNWESLEYVCNENEKDLVHIRRDK